MGNVFDQLEAEWRRLRYDRQAARQLADVARCAGHARSLEEVERYVRRAQATDSDRVLVALVAHVVGQDRSGRNPDLAARVLLQMLLPGTRNLARRWWALGDADDRAAAAVAAVYRRIRTYPLDRRPGRIAANVLLDAAQELRRSIPRLVVTPLADPTVLSPPRGSDPLPNPALELAEALQDAVSDGTITSADAEVIARSRIAGHRIADIAETWGIRPRTLWDRRQRAELALMAT